MKKFYEKSEDWFAIMWIIIYVVGVSIAENISKAIGIPSIITLFFSIGIVTVIAAFMKKNGLTELYGLCRPVLTGKDLLYFIPLAAICSINFWNGIAFEPSVGQCIITAAAKGTAGIAEELIFRGLLFVYMCRTNVKSAVAVSSLTFGMGHIVNLLNGAATPETICQIIYACAIGFCFAVVFRTGKSIIPCAVTHFIVNASSAFGSASQNTFAFHIAATIFLTVVSCGYGIWLMIRHKESFLTDIQK